MAAVLFPTVSFALFFLVVLPLSWLLAPRRTRWRLFIVGASWFFYGCWDWRFVGLIAASTVANQVFANLVAHSIWPRQRRRRLTFAIVANLGTLAWFKYAEFLSTNSSSLLRGFGLDVTLPRPDIVLPVGISFFTFQALSYLIDVYRDRIRPAPLLDFAVYLGFFPHLVAGPIVRAAELIPQLRHPPDARRVDATLAVWLIASGLFKKVVIASYLADRVVDPLFGFPSQHGGVEALIGVYAYAIQIYADFSGYTDMAIGLALLLGFRFPPNFDAPYRAVSLQDFWRRWHITLSRWLRDYLYIPLGGSQGRRWATYRNLLITMMLGGLWHGAAWTFVVWGGIHGVGLAAERWWRDRRSSKAESHELEAIGGKKTALLPRVWPVVARRIVTFHVVCLGWVFFRAESVGAAFGILGRIATGVTTTPINPVVVLTIAAALAAQYIPADAIGRLQAGFSRWALPAQATALALVLVVVDVLGPDGVAPFIYFRF